MSTPALLEGAPLSTTARTGEWQGAQSRPFCKSWEGPGCPSCHISLPSREVTGGQDFQNPVVESPQLSLASRFTGASSRQVKPGGGSSPVSRTGWSGQGLQDCAEARRGRDQVNSGHLCCRTAEETRSPQFLFQGQTWLAVWVGKRMGSQGAAATLPGPDCCLTVATSSIKNEQQPPRSILFWGIKMELVIHQAHPSTLQLATSSAPRTC